MNNFQIGVTILNPEYQKLLAFFLVIIYLYYTYSYHSSSL